jgi:hypothetical protein
MGRWPAPPKHGLPDTESAASPAADNEGTWMFAEAFLLLSGETTPESTVMYVRAELVVAWRLVVVAVLTRFRRNRLLGET